MVIRDEKGMPFLLRSDMQCLQSSKKALGHCPTVL
jgi:hypothetical protein